MGIHYQGPLTPEERELLKPKPPPPPWTVVSCRNLALRCPLLHRNGIETELDEDICAVTIRRGDLFVTMTARDDGWVSAPHYPHLDVPLESTVVLARTLHIMFSAGDTDGTDDPDGTHPDGMGNVGNVGSVGTVGNGGNAASTD